MVTREYSLQALDACRSLITCRVKSGDELVCLLSAVYGNDSIIQTFDIFNSSATCMQLSIEVSMFISRSFSIVRGDDISSLDLFDSSPNVF